MKLQFTVRGVPQSKGSRTQMGRVNVEAGTALSRKRKKAWADAVEREATEARLAVCPEMADIFPVATSCKVDVSFYMPIPKTRTKGKCKLAKDTPHTQKPDIDKLARGILDPLTVSGVLKDDCYVSELVCRKRWCDAGGERAEIIISF